MTESEERRSGWLGMALGSFGVGLPLAYAALTTWRAASDWSSIGLAHDPLRAAGWAAFVCAGVVLAAAHGLFGRFLLHALAGEAARIAGLLGAAACGVHATGCLLMALPGGPGVPGVAAWGLFLAADLVAGTVYLSSGRVLAGLGQPLVTTRLGKLAVLAGLTHAAAAGFSWWRLGGEVTFGVSAFYVVYGLGWGAILLALASQAMLLPDEGG